jgi:hypothetical protein
MRSFTQHCVAGLSVNAERMAQLVQGSLMLVTALTPHIGYDRSARIANHAQVQGCTLREVAIALGFVNAEQFDQWVDARSMLGPSAANTRSGFMDGCNAAASGSARFMTLGKSRLSSSSKSIIFCGLLLCQQRHFQDQMGYLLLQLGNAVLPCQDDVAVNKAAKPTMPCSHKKGWRVKFRQAQQLHGNIAQGPHQHKHQNEPQEGGLSDGTADAFEHTLPVAYLLVLACMKVKYGIDVLNDLFVL